MKKQLFIYTFLLFSCMASAQLFEVGAFVGGSNYIGDIGPTFYINPNRIALGGVAKYNYNARITIRGTAMYTRLHADDARATSSFRQQRGLQLNRNSVVEAALGIEFNFNKYSMWKVGYSQTPYIIAQIGATNYSYRHEAGGNKRITSIVLPLGVGYKFRAFENVGVAIESSFRYTFKDVIDGNNHALGAPYDFGNPKSDDWYVFSGITIVYAFGRPACNKDNFYR